MPAQTIYHRMKNLNTRMMANYKRGIGPTRVVMILTTIGRKSGLLRQTPLQYEEVDRDYYIASARGSDADWFKNIVTDPNVRVQIRIADFIELRLKRHPFMIHLIMSLFDGLPWRVSRTNLEEFCKEKAMVILHPNF